MERTEAGPSLKGRVRGMLHGVAFGDAVGATIEKLSAAEIRQRYGRVTSLEVDWHRAEVPEAARGGRIRGHGIVTDDTLMTLCLMAVYREAGRHLDAWDMAGGMVRQIAWTPRWIPEMQRETMLIERLFYPEKWIFQRHQLTSCDPREGGIGNMVNCGAAMYIAPVGAANACDPKAAYDEAIDLAAGHQHSYGLEAAGVMAACVAAAMVPGTTIEAVVDTAVSLAKDGTRAAIADIAAAARRLKPHRADHARVTAEFQSIIGRYSSMGDDVHRHPERAGLPTHDYTPSRLRSIEELPLALGFCLLNDGDFRASVLDGVNSGRDTDSIGCMAGAILGAMHGEAVIDPAERDLLDRANRFDLTAEADRFHDAVAGILAADFGLARLRDARRRALISDPAEPARAAAVH
ncbi:ADP-ribosylglycohydrolase family protein [Inquilinus sp. Marseille-Q2685]|uniref:ADP-ribosylglycohydrolase family protein n=1 Tax=Inquilinus sp. Marseille-Q2685 TaxID=2866581 RepID=UPI001CE3D9DC|nr:ADP-ribosylglycohydrolase family protein [Inquilinus sp. Marseille-Q2685]